MKRCRQCSQRRGNRYFIISLVRKNMEIKPIILCPKCRESRNEDQWHLYAETLEDARLHKITQVLQHHWV